MVKSKNVFQIYEYKSVPYVRQTGINGYFYNSFFCKAKKKIGADCLILLAKHLAHPSQWLWSYLYSPGTYSICQICSQTGSTY